MGLYCSHQLQFILSDVSRLLVRKNFHHVKKFPPCEKVKIQGLLLPD